MTGSGLVDWATARLLAHPRAVLATWLVVAGLGGIFAPQLIDHCKFSFDAVPGTPSQLAEARFQVDFPETVHQDVEVVLVSCESDCAGVAAQPFAARAVDRLRERCAELAASQPGIFQNWTDHFAFEASAAGRAGLRSPFLGTSNRTLLFQLSLKVVPERQTEVRNMLLSLRATAQDLSKQGQQAAEGPMSVAMTGSFSLFSDTLESTKQDIEQKDLFIVPFAMLVLAWRVRACRLLLIPLCCLLCTLATSFGLFVPIAKYVFNISPLAPSTMAFLIVALAIDYSLFLLTRYVEEAQSGASTEEAIRTMLHQSGHVVIISGSVLMICYIGVMCYPAGGVNTIGFGAALSVVLCAASNLTLTPCAIAAFPDLLGAEVFRGRTRPCCARRQDGAEPGSRRLGCWWRVGKAVTKGPGVVLVPLACMCLLVPACVELMAYRESFANTLTFPRGSSASLAYQKLEAEFLPGQLNPHYVLLPAPAGSTVASEAHFEAACDMAQRLLDRLSPAPFGLRPKHLLSVAVAPDPRRPDADELACLRWSSEEVDERHPFGPVTAERLLQLPGDLGDVYREQWSRLVSSQEGGRSAMLMLTLPFDPYGDTIRPFVKAAREVIGDDGSSGSIPRLLGTLTVVYDIVELTYARMPYIVAGTVLLVFGVIAVAFRAALAPLKMFFTVVVPLAAVFGVAVWVYQDGALAWLSINRLASPPGGGFYWATPVFTCTIIIGLALDYDVFLFARVVELRLKGFENGAAVRGALQLTGPIITSAGLIMAIAFCGLLLNDVPANNQIGFVMAFGVLLDTFVIRTCLVPSFLSLAAGLNYWPRRMPPPTRSDADLQEACSVGGGWDDCAAPLADVRQRSALTLEVGQQP